MNTHAPFVRGIARRAPRFLLVGCVALGAAGYAAGCARKTKPTTMTTTTTQPATDEVGQRLSGASDAAKSLANRAELLPGRSREEYVGVMREVFNDLAAALPLLQGPEQNGVFRQRLRTVQASASMLGALGSGLAPEPATDAGLRATADALAALAGDPQYAGAAQAAAVDAVKAKLEELDRTRGPMHHLVVADAVGQISQVVTALAAELEKQAAGDATPGAAPGEAAPGESVPTAPPPSEPAPAAPTEPAPAPGEPAPVPAPTEPAPAPAEPAPAPAEPAPAPAEPAPADPSK
jgi:hypothetical protein